MDLRLAPPAAGGLIGRRRLRRDWARSGSPTRPGPAPRRPLAFHESRQSRGARRQGLQRPPLAGVLERTGTTFFLHHNYGGRPPPPIPPPPPRFFLSVRSGRGIPDPDVGLGDRRTPGFVRGWLSFQPSVGAASTTPAALATVFEFESRSSWPERCPVLASLAAHWQDQSAIQSRGFVEGGIGGAGPRG